MYNEITNYAEWANDLKKFFAQITVNFNEENFSAEDVMQKIEHEIIQIYLMRATIAACLRRVVVVTHQKRTNVCRK